MWRGGRRRKGESSASGERKEGEYSPLPPPPPLMKGEEEGERREKGEGKREGGREGSCCYGNTHLIWTQTPEHNHLLEAAQLVIPVARQLLILGLHTVIVLLPCLHLPCEPSPDPLESEGRGRAISTDFIL